MNLFMALNKHFPNKLDMNLNSFIASLSYHVEAPPTSSGNNAIIVEEITDLLHKLKSQKQNQKQALNSNRQVRQAARYMEKCITEK